MQDWQLLQEYVESNSQAAFSALVERYLNLVYATCVRETGDPALAEDVTQEVFLLLARKATTLHPGTVLSGWLFLTSRFLAKNARRKEDLWQRRTQQAREILAHQDQGTEAEVETLWQQLQPLMHEGLLSLNELERNAILLRCFQGRTLKETGETLGLSEEAARKRVARALEKLRRYFGGQGVTVSVTVLATALSTYAIKSAPLSSAGVAQAVWSNLALSTGVCSVAPGALGTAQSGAKSFRIAHRISALGASPARSLVLAGTMPALVFAVVMTTQVLWNPSLRAAPAPASSPDLSTPIPTTAPPGVATLAAGTLIGKPMPLWDAKRMPWMNPEQPVPWSRFRSHVTVIEFFRVECPHCEAAVASRRALYHQYHPRGVEFIGFQSPSDSPIENSWKQVQGVVRSWKLPYSVAFDTKRAFFEKCGLSFFPTVLVVDRQGIVRFQQSGYDITKAKQLERGIAKILKHF